MTTFIAIQQSFYKESVVINGVPDLAKWITNIRSVHSKGALYIVIHDYVEVDGSGSQHDAFLLTPSEINWPGQSNESTYRSTYFHKSSHDSNIWILKSEYRSQPKVLRALVTNPSIIA